MSIQIWTGTNCETLAEVRRGKNLSYAAKRVARDYAATISRIGEISAMLRDEKNRRIYLMVVSP